MRTPVVGGNWKMNTTRADGIALATAVRDKCTNLTGSCDIIIAPPSPYLDVIGATLAGSGLALGAQNVYHEPKGAFTGEVSTAMLRDVGATWVILGHSERRHVLGESDDLIRKKIHAALNAKLLVILCIGETESERSRGETNAVNLRQLRAGLDGVARDALQHVVIAYEPVWAIGTGKTATPDDAQTVHKVIRKELASLYDDSHAAETRIQYGGSVKPDNAAELIAQPDIDGFLVGGASLNADDFGAIVQAAADHAA